MTPAAFQALVQGYKEGRLTEAEWSVLREALAEGRYDYLIEEDIRQTFEREDGANWSPAKEKKIWRQIQDVTTGPAAPEKDTARIFRWLGRAAAAVVLILAGGFYLFHGKEKKQAPMTVAVRPVPPGGNRAFLVLASGERVMLDAINKGAVSSQGGVQVLKLDSGLLAYQTAASDEVRATGDKLQAASQVVYNTIMTPRGGQYQVILPDGTKVWLNAASSLRFPTAFTGKERWVELSGEAYFEVKHNSAQPFRLKAGGQVIEDLGTSFNVNTYDDETVARTTLIEGSARVTGAGKHNVTLHPGQQAQWKTDGEISLVDGVDTEDVIAWKNGQISFANADFQSLMRQIARWYDVDIHYTGAVPKAHFFGILNRNVYLSSILEYLQHNGMHVRQEGKDIIISP
jgi:ferric-dicitrate binding protein FerR (iron transport regulator)